MTALPTRRDLTRRLKQTRATLAWLKDNPDLAVSLVTSSLGLTRAEEVAPLAGHEEPAVLADYPHQVRAVLDIDAAPAVVLATVADPASYPTWFTPHASWREPVVPLETGAQVRQQLRLMGIPAEVAWTVDRADDSGLTLQGDGPMGLRLALVVSVVPTRSGSSVAVYAGLAGDPVQGPVGVSIVRSLRGELDASLAALAAYAGTATTVGDRPVLHEATGRRLDPRTPIIVGAGQVVQREFDPALRDPAGLSAEAVRRAVSDAGSDALLERLDAIYAVASASWSYRDQARAVADALGVDVPETVMSARYGGDAGQVLVNAAAEAVAQGRLRVAVVTGAEAGSSLAEAQKRGLTPDWPEQADDVVPTEVIGSDKEANNGAETAAGLAVPVYNYALMESVLRTKAGRTPAEHRLFLDQLWAGLSEVAAANAYAWQPTALSAERLGDQDGGNRPISSPYSKLLCANLQVDLASALVVCSVAEADRLGIPQDRWVFVHAGASAYDEWFVSERGDLAASPAIREIGRVALADAGLAIDDVAHIDLYSCFPAAVQIAAAELGLPIGDRPLSVTGGLTFAGGPGNNYGGHAVATMVGVLREDPGSFGLTTSLGWYSTKHALGIYSTTPPEALFEWRTPVLDPVPSRPVRATYTGSAVVEAATVVFGRDGAGEAAILSVLDDQGGRVIVRSEQADVVAAGDDLVGRVVTVEDTSTVTLTADSAALPPPPEMPLLTEVRDGILVITVNRPAQRNAIDLRTATLLETAIDRFEADPDLRVAVLTGAGGYFSAGMDLKAVSRGELGLTEKRGLLGIAALPPTKPLIAAVEGPALAGGCELALAADLIVASTESVFGIPEPKRGLVAAAGGVLRLSQRLPRNIAMELALTGNPMPATRLAELGLVNRLAPPGGALDAALALAQEIVANAPLSVSASKQIIVESPDWPVEEAYQRQSDVAGPALVSQDAGEGIAAFVEKRPPVWTGR